MPKFIQCPREWIEVRMIRIALRHALCVVALMAGLPQAAWAQEAAVTRRAIELRDAPADSGRALASLPAQAAVTRTAERKGPWVQVRTADGATGWVHLFDIGPAGAPAESGGGGGGGALRGVTSLFGGTRATQTGGTAGIRGLEAQDIANANPNPAAVTQMEALRQGEGEARAFADRVALRPVAVDPLPSPSASRTSVQPGSSARSQEVAP
jgi:hypothetical protein